MAAAALTTVALGLAPARPAGAAIAIIYPQGPDPAVARWPSWPYPVGCWGAVFDPVAVFSGPTEAENGPGAPEAALRAYLQAELTPELPKRFWRVLLATGTRVEFASGRLESGLFLITFQLSGGEWKFAEVSNGCRPRTIREGNAAISWSVRDEEALSPSARRVQVVLHADGCDGGRNRDEAAEPEFRQVGRRLLLTIWLEPLPPGVYSCAKRREGPLTLGLPGRLGRRSLWDGGTYPPREVLSARSARLRQ